MTKNRRPPSRAARQLAAQKSSEGEDTVAGDLSPQSPVPPATLTEASGKAKLLQTTSGQKTGQSPASKPAAPSDIDDLFESCDLFDNGGESKVTLKPKAKLEIKTPASPAPKPLEGPPVSLLPNDANCEDLFKPAKLSPKPSPVSFLDDQDDLFTGKKTQKRKTSKPSAPPEMGPAVKDIFEDDIFSSEAVKLPPVKTKELEANLFDDDVDIFADLAVKPKGRNAKKKVEAKSIFNEDMDDIFLPTNQVKPRSKKTQAVQASSGAKSEPKASSTFEDPLNAFEGQ